MDLRHLQYFIVVAEELHFGRAAKRLKMTQPPLSQQIQQLEDEMGVQLLSRSKRQVELTHAGMVFLMEARKTLSQLQRATNLARRAERGEVGHIVVGYVALATFDILPRMLKRYVEEYPNINVVLREMSSSEQVNALLSREIDVGVLRVSEDTTSVAMRTVHHVDCVGVVSRMHRLACARCVSLRELSAEPMVATSRASYSEYFDEVIRFCWDSGFSPFIGVEAPGFQAILGFVGAGLGYSIVPATIRHLRAEDVHYLDLASPAPAIDLALAWRHLDTSSTIQAFLNTFSE